MGLFGNSSAGIEVDIGNYSTSLSHITINYIHGQHLNTKFAQFELQI